MTGRTVHRSRRHIAYLGLEGRGTPLLLLHGVGSSIETWGDLPERLNESGRPVLAVDLVGHGDSGHGNGDYSLGANASAVRDLLDELDIDRVHLVGHSLGGGVAMQFAYQYPERVSTLTLISSGGLGTEVNVALRAASLPGSELVMRVLCSERVVTTLAQVSGAAHGIGYRTDAMSAKTVAHLRRLQDARRLRAFLTTVRGVIGPQGQRVSALGMLDHLDAEDVLIIWGDRDPMLPVKHGWQAAQHLPGSTFVLVPDAQHHPYSDQPDVVARAILDHLAHREGAGASEPR